MISSGAHIEDSSKEIGPVVIKLRKLVSIDEYRDYVLEVGVLEGKVYMRKSANTEFILSSPIPYFLDWSPVYDLCKVMLGFTASDVFADQLKAELLQLPALCELNIDPIHGHYVIDRSTRDLNWVDVQYPQAENK